MSKKIIIAGGGTGGHIFPAIAIAHALKRLDSTIEILFVGAKNKMEMEKVPKAGFDIIGLDIVGFNRSSLIKNFSLPFKLVKSYFQARSIIKNFRPNVAVGVGGYASFPMLKLAQQKNIPTVLSEQNSFAGKTNMLLGKRAAKICVAYNEMERFFPSEKIILTGNPVRTKITEQTVSRAEALKFFSMRDDKKTVLVIGGSLGAKSINEAIEKKLQEIENAGIQLIWQTGKDYLQKAKASINGKSGMWVNDFITEMEVAYAAADVVISRAGAISISELCVVKKPVLFVPFPFAAEDHQTVNAESLVKKNAALMIKDSDAASEIVPKIIELLKDENKQKELIKNIGALAIVDADVRIANEILKLS